ncbi:HTH domain-containing protein [Leifsonia sp. EB34]|uniref:HTH domain-containing protein n=1 Tax=Leifsonia sp. EB34 TaxID=3156303 RepID=UPI003516172F
MTSQPFDVADELRSLIAQGSISVDALHAVTGIRPDDLQSFLGENGGTGLTTDPQSLTVDQGARLALLAAQLTEGMRIGSNERLKAIFESLTVECRLSPQNLTQLTGVPVEDIESVLRDPRTVPVEKRYALAITGAYLVNAFNQARG